MQTVKLVDFLKEYGDQIAQSVVKSYPPIYTFDKRENYVAEIKKLKRKPFLCQMDAICATAELFLTESCSSGVIVGEMGTGKSLVAAVIAYVCEFKKILIVAPPHLVLKWEREIKITLPDGVVECHHLKRFTDVDKAINVANASKDKFHVFIVGRERAKLSYQWRPAFNWKKLLSEEGKERKIVKLIVCPGCGATVLDKDGIPIDPEDVKSRKLTCEVCKEPMWQAKETGPRRFAIAEHIKRKHRKFFDLLVIDECFPAGVKVETLCGEKNIEDVKVGDYVLSSNGKSMLYKKVVRTIKKTTTEPILTIRHDNGHLPCTGNHRIFTERGEIRADHITENDKVYYLGDQSYDSMSILRERCCENWLQILFKRMFCFIDDKISEGYSLQGVRKGHGGLSRREEEQKALFSKMSPQQQEKEVSFDKNLQMVRQEHDNNSEIDKEKILQRYLCCTMEDVTAGDKRKDDDRGSQAKNRRETKKGSEKKPGTKKKYVNKDEAKESNTAIECEKGNIGLFEAEAVPEQTWRERERATCSTGNIIINVELADRGYDQNKKRNTALLLQCGFGQFRVEDCYRMRRTIARNNKSAEKRSKEGQISSKDWMDCAEIQEQGDCKQHGQRNCTNRTMCKAEIVGVEKVNTKTPIFVYNLEVEETHNYFANNVLVANCHEYRGRGTAQGTAIGNMASVCKKSLGLTGTLAGGYASSIFHLLYRITRRFKDDYGHDQVGRWIDHYGIWEKVTKYTDAQAYNDNSSSKGRKYVSSPREKPGISPVILPKYLLDKTVFIRLSDIAIDLPTLTEEIIDVSMSQEQEEAYNDFYEELRTVLLSELKKGNKSLLAVYLQSLLTYPDRCTVGEEVYDKADRLIASAPGLNSDVLYPKEQALIDRIKKEKAEGRKVLVFCTHTNRRDVTARLQEKIQSNGNNIRSGILKASVPAEKREAWIKDHAGGLDCLITNPALVQTGLDLIEFPTIAYCQSGYSVYTLRQSSRRSHRIGQEKPVKILYYVYTGTMQEQALKLLALKMKASLVIEGELGEDGLATYNIGHDNLFYELARNIANNVNIEDGLDSIWRSMQEQERDSVGSDLLIESLDDFNSKPGCLNGALKIPVAEIKKRYNPKLLNELYMVMMKKRGEIQDMRLKRREKREATLPTDRHRQIGLF